MATTLINFIGWETSSTDFEPYTDVTGTGSILGTNAVVRARNQGNYHLQGAGGGFGRTYFALNPRGETVPGGDFIIGFHIAKTTWSGGTGSSGVYLMNGTSQVSCGIEFANNGGDIFLIDDVEADVQGPISSGFLDYTVGNDYPYYYLELRVTHNTASGNMELFIDGVSQGLNTGVDVGPIYGILLGQGQAGGQLIIDNLYFLAGVTDSSERLGESVVVTERTSAVLTPDSGPDLDSGSWAAANGFTGTSTTINATYGGAAAGSVICDDIGVSSGVFIKDLGGTTHGMVGYWRATRTNGSATNHWGLWGNSGDGVTRTAILPLDTVRTEYNFFTTDPTIVPNGVDEYIQIGMELDGNRDFELMYMGAVVLVSFPPTATPSPPPLMSLPYRAMRHMIIR